MQADTALLIDFWPHPLTAEGRRRVVASAGETLASAMAAHLDPWDHAIGIVNDRRYPRAQWDTVALVETDRVVVRREAEGFALATFIGPALGITSTLGITILGVAISLVGMFALNLLIRPRIPKGDGGGQAERQYSLSSGSNRVRRYAPVQLLLGTHRMFPDLESQPYTEYDEDGDQFLAQVFDFGIGENLAQGPLHLGETELIEYDDVTTQTGVTSVTLVSGNVDTIEGPDLTYNMPETRTTAGMTTAIAFDLVGRHYRVSKRGSLGGREIAIRLQWRVDGSSGAWTTRNVTLQSPDGAEARNYVRRSFKYATGSADAWETRVTLRTEHDADDANLAFEAQWQELRAYQDAETDFTGRNPLAIRAKATGQLHGAMDSLNAVCSQEFPDWDADAEVWTMPQATSNPAAIYLAYLRGWRIDGRLVAGLGIEDSRIDLPSIQAFHEHCTALELEYNAVLEDGDPHNDVMETICQCGWGSVDRSTGKWGVIFEDNTFSDGVPAIGAVVNPASIITDSVSITYDHENLADEIVGEFIDKTGDYRPNQVRRTVPGVTNPVRPVVVTLDGIVDGEQAAKELNRLVAVQFYHTRTITWEMLADEARYLPRGEVVGLTHGIAGLGTGGRFLVIEADRRTVTPSVTVHDPGYMWVWNFQGDVTAHTYVVQADGKLYLTAALEDAVAHEDPSVYRFMAFREESHITTVRITKKEPAGTGRIRFSARDEYEEYYGHRTSDLTWDPLPIERILYSGTGVPQSFVVYEDEVGARHYRWSYDEDPRIVGYKIRYSADQSDTFRQMRPVHSGLLTSDPLVSLDAPDAIGLVRFGIASVDSRGLFSRPAYTTTILTDASLRGEDGRGVEYCFASSEDGAEITTASTAHSHATVVSPNGTVTLGGAGINAQVGDQITVDGVSYPITVRTSSNRFTIRNAPDTEVTANTLIWVRYANLPNNEWTFDDFPDAGLVRGMQRYFDGLPNDVDDSRPFVIRFRRAVPGTPDVGAARGTDAEGWGDWQQESAVRMYGIQGLAGVAGADGSDGLDGIDGVEGDDGNGVEYIFAATATTVTTIPNNQLPLNTWNFDQPQTRNNLAWKDGVAGTGLGEAKPRLWRAQRRVPGSPVAGTAPDTSTWGDWTTPEVVSEFGYGFEYVFAVTEESVTAIPTNQRPSNAWGFDEGGTAGTLVWTDGAPDLTDDKPVLWRAQRRLAGIPAAGAAVAANWTVPVIVARRGAPGVAGADGSDGLDGIDGVEGDDGQGVEYVFAATAASVTTIPTNQLPLDTWNFDQPQTRNTLAWKDGVEGTGLGEAKPKLWQAQRRVPGSPATGTAPDTSTWGSWTTPEAVSEFGYGFEYVFAVTAADVTSIPNSQLPSNAWGFDSGGTSGGLTWSDSAPLITTARPILWRAQRRLAGIPAAGAAVSANWSTPARVAILGTDGEAGNDGVDGDDGLDGEPGRRGLSAYAVSVTRTSRESAAANVNEADEWFLSGSTSDWSGLRSFVLAGLEEENSSFGRLATRSLVTVYRNESNWGDYTVTSVTFSGSGAGRRATIGLSFVEGEGSPPSTGTIEFHYTPAGIRGFQGFSFVIGREERAASQALTNSAQYWYLSGSIANWRGRRTLSVGGLGEGGAHAEAFSRILPETFLTIFDVPRRWADYRVFSVPTFTGAGAARRGDIVLDFIEGEGTPSGLTGTHFHFNPSPGDGGTGPTLTSDVDNIYIRGTAAPGAPAGGTTSENHLPTNWSRTNPGATETEDVYRASRTRNFSDGTFTTATAWGSVTKVADRTGTDAGSRTEYIFRQASTTPTAPAGGTATFEHEPTGWESPNPVTSTTSPLAPTTTLGVYRASRTANFTSATHDSTTFDDATAWGSVTRVAAPTGTVVTLPGAPTAISASLGAYDQGTGRYAWTLSWGAPSSFGSGTFLYYEVQRRVAGPGSWGPATPRQSTDRSEAFTIAVSTANDARVRTVTDAGSSPWSTRSRIITSPAAPATTNPGEPTNIRAGTRTRNSASTASSFTFLWSAPASFGSGTFLRYRYQYFGSFSFIPTAGSTTTGTSATVTRTDNLNTIYTLSVRVRTETTVGESAYATATLRWVIS